VCGLTKEVKQHYNKSSFLFDATKRETMNVHV